MLERLHADKVSTQGARSSVVNGPFTGSKERRSFKPKVASSILVGRMGSSAGRCRWSRMLGWPLELRSARLLAIPRRSGASRSHFGRIPRRARYSGSLYREGAEPALSCRKCGRCPEEEGPSRVAPSPIRLREGPESARQGQRRTPRGLRASPAGGSLDARHSRGDRLAPRRIAEIPRRQNSHCRGSPKRHVKSWASIPATGCMSSLLVRRGAHGLCSRIARERDRSFSHGLSVRGGRQTICTKYEASVALGCIGATASSTKPTPLALSTLRHSHSWRRFVLVIGVLTRE